MMFTFNFLEKKFYCICVCVSVCMCVYVMCVQESVEVRRKKALDPLDLKLQVVVRPAVGTGTHT